jgi:DNA-binding transcriptional LysR family regulator
MRDLNDLYYFVQVVDHGGFAKAARALGLHKSFLSRRIASLEELVGLQLLQRSTRRFSVTDIGKAYYQSCVRVLEQVDEAEATIERARSQPKGILRVTCPTALLRFLLEDAIPTFLASFPQVDIHMEASNRRVDVIAEGIDIALRVRFPPLEDSGLVMRKLDESKQFLVASPQLIRTQREVLQPRDLEGWPSLVQGSGQASPTWRLTGADREPILVNHVPRLATDDVGLLRNAALDGLGAVQMPTFIVWDDVRRGALVRLLPEWTLPTSIIHAVFSSRKGLLPSVLAFLDFLSAECATRRQAIEASGLD